ncbi:hypothetical protein GCM10010924_13500 [Rhizobium wenxiniae]|uniref:Uncharacterized protein n=1 Tax=Rhizobium wenxiniae TaxID=1737357 RepID=A0A7W9Y492_9HYPH|nr:hypothetical protein [Rhizobium wenxiniae]MBB6161198.1 hypothetical protein [Rhizobium wenxiniae]GGF87087.1 hypothetical protein GCM10010924_13500 [Rhizobium wenxiniae]
MARLLSNHAIYTPAISTAYARYGHGESFKRDYTFEEKQLHFLNPKTMDGLFHYPCCLYSAGQAAKTKAEGKKTTFVSKSVRNEEETLVIGDSGGYQIQQGTIKFDGDNTCDRILKWLEAHADYSMTLDFPTGGISSGKMEPHLKRLVADGHNIEAMTAQNGQALLFNAALHQSLLNLDYFVKHRTIGKTKFLNVIQGRNEAESKIWYDGVKGYDLEGWAFAGVHQKKFSMVLNRLLDMWSDGYLQKAEWIHFLGVSTFPAAYLFTTVLRCIRQVNPSIGISFDTSNAFTLAVNGLFYASARQDKHVSSAQHYQLPEVAPDNEDITLNELCSRLSSADVVPKDQLTPWNNIFKLPANTHIGERVRMSDLLMLRKTGKGRKMTPDGITFLMNHNAEFLLRCFRRLNTNIDNSAHQDFIPTSAYVAKSCIEQVLNEALIVKNVHSARAMIQRMEPMLDVLAVK